MNNIIESLAIGVAAKYILEQQKISTATKAGLGTAGALGAAGLSYGGHKMYKTYQKGKSVEKAQEEINDLKDKFKKGIGKLFSKE